MLARTLVQHILADLSQLELSTSQSSQTHNAPVQTSPDLRSLLETLSLSPFHHTHLFALRARAR